MNTYYTTQMLADPNASNAGFLAVLIFLIALACFYILFDFEGFIRDSKTIVFVSTIIVSIAAYFSYFYPFAVPLNEPVTATLVNTFESPIMLAGNVLKLFKATM